MGFTALEKVKKGSIGVTFTYDCDQDVSTATTYNIILITPTGTVKTFTGSKSEDSNEYITYTTTSAEDLDVVGKWKIMVDLVMPTFTGKTDACFFFVEDEYA